MRALFFGSPDFAVPCLRALNDIADIPLVIAQPDRPAGRGLKLKPPAVKTCALDLGLDVYQPKKVRTAAFAEKLAAYQADVAVVVAYGRILPPAVLAATCRGCINVHASILPKWRGAAPITWSVVSGDKETGVSIMQLDEGMDTGPVYAIEKTEIGPQETAGELFERLAKIGADTLRKTLPQIVDGSLKPKPQPKEGMTHARMLKKEDGLVDWKKDAQAVHDHIRGMSPWPGAYTFWGDKKIRLFGSVLVEDNLKEVPAGTFMRSDDEGALIACMGGAVRIAELQLAGKKRQPARIFTLGHRDVVGSVLS